MACARLGLVMLLVVASQGCALTRAHSVGEGSFENYVSKLRELGVQARPVSRTFAASIEAHDEILSAALVDLEIFPGPLQRRRVAERYRELKIYDAAYDHFWRARQLDPQDAAAYEGLARIWRDWGFPHLGLGEASRAVYYAPSWPVAHNTLGTILTAMGRVADARRAYRRALALDPHAAYVLNNLCYLSFLEGQLASAIEECRSALEEDPGFVAARNNLALAYAAAQRDDLALREFRLAGDAATASYNIGVVHLAERKYKVASQAFDDASRQRPSWLAARKRATSTRALATKSDGQTP